MVRKKYGLDYTDESSVTTFPRDKLPASGRKTLETLSPPIGYPVHLPSRDLGVLRSAVPDATRPDDERAKHGAKAEAYASAWRLAFAPCRNLVTGAFALFMTGTSVHLFSVMTAVTILFVQVSALSAHRAGFQGMVLAHPELKRKLLPQYFVHLLLCLVGVSGALWQCNRLGFLPTTESDFTAFLPHSIVDPNTNTLVGGLSSL